MPPCSFAGLNFIRAAFCPLEFSCMKLGEHPAYQGVVQKDPALARLEVGESLHYPRQFPYTDRNNHRRVGTQIITAPFGLSPVDFDMFLGLFSYLKSLDELPADLQVHLTADFIGKLAGLPTTCPDDYDRIRSRVFRFSYVKYTNSAAWNSAAKSYEAISNFEFYSLKSMSRLTQSRQPITLQLSQEFARIIREAPAMAFDGAFYRSLPLAMRRLHLLAHRDAWNQRDSMTYDADAFCIHQLGYAAHTDAAKDRLRRKDRLAKLRRLLNEAEERDLIRPYHPWHGYLVTHTHGPLRGRRALRWSRGPALRVKDQASARSLALDDDPLYDQVKHLRDEHGLPLSAPAYRRLLSQHGRGRLQKHVAIVQAQKELQPGSFKRSEVATFVDRVQHDYAPPDWYADLRRTQQSLDLDQIRPSRVAESLYQAIARQP